MRRDRFAQACIVIADDEEAQLDLLSTALEPGGYGRVCTTSDPGSVVELCREKNADLLLLDIRMPGMNGHEVLDQIRDGGDEADQLPVLVLTNDSSRETKRRVFDQGADDFLPKPVSPMELRLRVDNHLARRFLRRDLRRQNHLLEARVEKRTADLRAAQIEMLETLAICAEYRDDETGEHTRRVGRLAAALARDLGLPEERIGHLRRAAPLHDVGKIGISDDVLLKPGPLTDREMATMENHTLIGESILSGSQFPILRMGETIARSHHERWDGDGYPDGLSRTDIPLPARIVQVADVFDSLTHERSYKDAWSIERAVDYVSEGRETEFDPDVAGALLSLDLETLHSGDEDEGRAEPAAVQGGG